MSADDLALLQTLPIFAGLEAAALRAIEEGMEAREMVAGDVLVRAGEIGDAMFVVVAGHFRVVVDDASGVGHVVGHLGPGDPVGEIQMVLGGARSATVIAEDEGRVLRLRREAFDAVAQAAPEAMRHLVDVVTRRLRQVELGRLLPQLLGPLGDAVFEELSKRGEWITLPRGQALFRQGDASDAWYVVASGRLQVAIAPPGGVERVVREIGRGESVGEIAILTDDVRTASLYAVRDTQLVRFEKAAFEEVLLEHPRAMRAINRVLIKRLVTLGAKRVPREAQQNIAVIGVGPDAPVAMVARRLTQHLAQHATALHLDARRLSEHGVVHDASNLPQGHPGWLRFAAWLEEQSTRARYVILETDTALSGWTREAIRQADQLVIVADAKSAHAIGEIEATLSHESPGARTSPESERRARRTLVLVHDDASPPTGVARWLEKRVLDRHVHVRASREADFGRLARLLTGRALGLALGGGGARGYAHVGVLRALEELGIPIDVIGGTSMGSVIAAMYAMGLGPDEMIEANRKIIATNPFTEYTLPITSLVASQRITAASQAAFGDRHIEDLWLNYLCVSTNLTTAQMVVHERGPVWQATRASGSLPGILVPVLLDGSLLADGGVMNNLPSDLVQERGGGPVIAVDVSTEEDLSFSYPTIPSPWEVMWNRMMPFQKTKLASPSIATILMRTVMLASVNRTRANEAAADLYLRPPIEKFDMLEFEKIEELVEIGHRHALEHAGAWVAATRAS